MTDLKFVGASREGSNPFMPTKLWRSSKGKSTLLIRVRLWVQSPPPQPKLKREVFMEKQKQIEKKIVLGPTAEYFASKEKQLKKLWNKPLSLWPKDLFPEMPKTRFEMKSGTPGS